MSSRVVDTHRVRRRAIWWHRTTASAVVVLVAALVTSCSDPVGTGIDRPTGGEAGAEDDSATSGAGPTVTRPPAGPETVGGDNGNGNGNGDGDDATAGGAVDDDLDADPDAAPDPACVDPGPAEPVRIRVWHALGGEQSFLVLSELVAQFETGRPGIEVELVDVAGYAGALQAIRRATAEELPDLFMGAVDDARRFTDSSLFVSPERCRGGEPEVFEDLLPVVRATLTLDEVVQAYPFNISTPVMIYDRTLFARAGLDPDRPPATPDELRGALEVIADAGEAPGGLVLYDRSASWVIEQWAAADGRVLVEPDNGRHGHPVDGVRFVTEEAVMALDWLRGLVDDDLATWVGRNESGIDDLLRLVDLSDRAAITFHTSASLGELVLLVYETGLPGLDEADLGVGPLPTPSGQPAALVGGGAWWLVDRDDPIRLGAAAALAEHLLDADAQATFTAATGYVPATRAAADSPITRARWDQYPQLSVASGQLAGLTGSPAESGMQIGPRVAVQRILETAAADVLVLGRDPAEVLLDAEAAAIAVIAAYEADLTSRP